ncbi:MAG: PEP/pyruvate-binding domain-containing protein [Candidatus Rifleibacteriota bacterium]
MPNEELLQVFKKYKSDSEIFHDLMRFKVRELLLVATVFDAYALEQDGLLAEKIFGEYFHLNLTNAPRITSVTSSEEALEKLDKRDFQLVVVLSRLNKLEMIKTGEIVKDRHPDLPVLLLLNDNADLEAFDARDHLCRFYDNIFVWNGNSEIFLAMIKYVEDSKNADPDTQIAQVRIILLVEDSIRYYSRYLPHLYSELIRQTAKLVEEEMQEETKKVLKMRCRPKIILATNYEEALELFDFYREYLLCVISDVKYNKDGILDEKAGLKLAHKLKELQPDLPILLQSSELEIEAAANKLGAAFLHKDSQFLSKKLSKFFYRNLGFGDFVFRNSEGKEITRARTMADFRNCLRIVPAESIEHHASRNHFSTWLLARGEVQTAKVVSRIHISEFDQVEALRDFLINMGNWVFRMKTRGKVISFDKSFIGETRHHISKLAEGSIGGKARGIAFMNYLLYNSTMLEAVPDITIKIPETFIIGLDEFANFIAMNDLVDFVAYEKDYEKIKEKFLQSRLSDKIKDRLRIVLQKINYPLAIRSSGLLEDSVSHSMSGLYETFFLPNNHPDLEIRLKQVEEAIKLVYASVYSSEAREYFEAINYNIEEEKMAVVIQQIVGRQHGQYFYPMISGIGQSFNYYPFSYIKPEDGVGMLVLGLGRHVVGGERSFRFCPTYPKLEILTPEELVRNSQKRYYALDLSKNTVNLIKGEDATLVKLDIADADSEVLYHIASTWNHLDRRLEVGIDSRGPRVLNFANIIQFESFPLARAMKHLLNVSEEALETPVEIEFAVEMEKDEEGEEGEKPVFYLLQMKHMLRESEECTIDTSRIENNQLLLYADGGMGNGKIEHISDIIWIDPDEFDKSETEAMAREIEEYNQKLKAEGKKYLLMGPGRWGTRDRWLGIPITWPQASFAKVIIEYSLDNFRVDASMGSHFFHNVTTMNIGYFSVRQDAGKGFIDWEWLRKQPKLEKKKYFIHSRVNNSLGVVMDGRKAIFIIYKDNEDSKVITSNEVEIETYSDMIL